MKTFLYSIPNQLQSFSKKLDVKSVLCGKSWDIFNDEGVKQLFIFNRDRTMFVTNNGDVINASWKYISQNSSILITIDNETIMFRPAFFNKDVVVLKRDGTERFLFMIEEGMKTSSALFTLEDLIEYIDKEIAWASMDAEEQKRLLELERQREIEEEKKLREIKNQQEEEEKKRQRAIEEQREEEERKRQEELKQRNKQAERDIILDYMKAHKNEIGNRLLKRKKTGKIGIIPTVVLILLSFFIPSIELKTVIIISLTISALIFIILASSSYIDVIRPHIEKGVNYHTNSEVQKMYEEL